MAVTGLSPSLSIQAGISAAFGAGAKILKTCSGLLKDLDIEAVGPGFENHPVFPNRTNTEFVEVLDRHTVNMRVWERGSGETLACGTGACAVGVASALCGLTEDRITVHLLGGDLEIFWDRLNNLVYMTGPASVVFDGEITLPADLR